MHKLCASGRHGTGSVFRFAPRCPGQLVHAASGIGAIPPTADANAPAPWDLLSSDGRAYPGMVRVRQISANTAALGLGTRSMVWRSTRSRPKHFEYPPHP